VKKLLGKNEVEDALKRLDALTQEEVRMATAEVLKVTQSVDDKVTGLTALVDGKQNTFLALYPST
jgi:copper chaperone CopZ